MNKTNKKQLPQSLIYRVQCQFGEFGIRSIDIFLYSHHLSALQCIDIERRKSVLVTPRVKGLITSCQFAIKTSLMKIATDSAYLSKFVACYQMLLEINCTSDLLWKFSEKRYSLYTVSCSGVINKFLEILSTYHVFVETTALLSLHMPQFLYCHQPAFLPKQP